MNVISSLGRRFRTARNPFTPPLLVMNDAPAKPGTLQKVIINFLPANTRMETLEDRSYTVIPMVMMVEGVHAGSGGPIYYPTDELSKTPQVWNHKPIVVYHPEGSACDPIVVENRKVGMMMNTKWDDKGKRLLSEAWLERSRADKIDNRVFKAVEAREMMEVSTGLYVDLEESDGEWNDEEYIGIARNLRADHLALLPDKIGACSIADGAGLMRNQRILDNYSDDEARDDHGKWTGGGGGDASSHSKQAASVVSKTTSIASNFGFTAEHSIVGKERGFSRDKVEVTFKSSDKDNPDMQKNYSSTGQYGPIREALNKEFGSRRIQHSGSSAGKGSGSRASFVITLGSKSIRNEMSLSNISEMLRIAIQERMNPNASNGGIAAAYVWVCDVYSNFFVYAYDGKLFRLSYSSSDTGVTLGSEKPVEVTRVTEYRTVDGAKYVGNEDQPQNADSIMKKAQIIAAILAANCGWSDQKALEGLNDKQLESIHNGVKGAAAEDKADGGADDADENPDGTKKGKMKKNDAPADGTTITANAEAAKPVTLEDWEKTAPAEVVAAFRSIKNEQESDRTKLIETITANTALGFTKEDLKTMDLANLRRLAKVAETPTQNGFQMPQMAPNYSGMAPASPLNADGQPYVEEGLPMPVMNFRKPGKEAAAAA